MKFIYWTLILQPYLQPVSGPFFGPSRVIGQQRYRQPRKREIRELKQEDFSRRRRGEIREGPGLTSSFSSQI